MASQMLPTAQEWQQHGMNTQRWDAACASGRPLGSVRWALPTLYEPCSQSAATPFQTHLGLMQLILLDQLRLLRTQLVSHGRPVLPPVLLGLIPQEVLPLRCVAHGRQWPRLFMRGSPRLVRQPAQCRALRVRGCRTDSWQAWSGTLSCAPVHQAQTNKPWAPGAIG